MKQSHATLQAEHLEYLRTLRPPELSEDQRKHRDERWAENVRMRARQHEKSYGLLAPGTLVRPEISWLRDHWLVVVNDPGPASNEGRTVVIKRREPERDNEIYRVRRDRMAVYTPNIENTPAGLSPGAPPPPGVLSGDIADAGRDGQ